MAAGRFGTSVLAANTAAVVYTAPLTSYFSEVDISVLNPATTDAVLEVALSTTDTAAEADYIEKGAIAFKAGGVIVRSGVKLSPGERVIVKSNVAGVVVRVAGVEKTAGTAR